MEEMSETGTHRWDKWTDGILWVKLLLKYIHSLRINRIGFMWKVVNEFLFLFELIDKVNVENVLLSSN